MIHHLLMDDDSQNNGVAINTVVDSANAIMDIHTHRNVICLRVCIICRPLRLKYQDGDSMSMSKRVDVFLVIGVILCSIIIVGEYSIYAVDIYDFDVDATSDGGGVYYSVRSSGSSRFDAILFLNSSAVKDVFIFVDEKYDEHYGNIENRGPHYIYDQSYVADQYSKQLKARGVDVTSSDSKGLYDYITGTMSAPSGHAILVSSYALPSSVYTGDADDILLKWISGGGRLYWIGSEAGRYYHSDGGLVTVSDNQMLLFGSDDSINIGETFVAEHEIQNGFREALSLQNSRVTYGLKVSSSDLSIGYEQDGYASIAFAEYGLGDICVIAGKSSIEQMADIGQVIASGICHDTVIVEHITGNVCRGAVKGTFDGTGDSVYLYIGGIYTVHGGAFDV